MTPPWHKRRNENPHMVLPTGKEGMRLYDQHREEGRLETRRSRCCHRLQWVSRIVGAGEDGHEGDHHEDDH